MDITALAESLLIISGLTALITQAVKLILAERGVDYKSNTIAGIVAVAIALLFGGYTALFVDGGANAHTAVQTACMAVLSWLCAMLGYDKVVQAITQFTSNE